MSHTLRITARFRRVRHDTAVCAAGTAHHERQHARGAATLAGLIERSSRPPPVLCRTGRKPSGYSQRVAHRVDSEALLFTIAIAFILMAIALERTAICIRSLRWSIHLPASGTGAV